MARSSQEPGGIYTVFVTPGGPRAPAPQTGNPLGGSEARAMASVPSPCAHVQGTGSPGWVRPAVPPVFFLVLFVTHSLGAQVHRGSCPLCTLPRHCASSGPLHGGWQLQRPWGLVCPSPPTSRGVLASSRVLSWPLSPSHLGPEASGWNQQTGRTVVHQQNSEWAHMSHQCPCSGRGAPCV